MHFFNPAPVQQFVEVIRTVITADDVFEDVKALAERLGKKPVVVGDKAGFIANALLFGYLNHAVSMFESRYATRRTSTRRCASGAATPWVRSRCSTSSVSTRPTRSSTRCTSRAATGCTPRARSSSRWWRRDARPQERARLLHLRRAGLAAGRPGRADAVGGPPAGVALRPVASVGVVGSGTMATGIIEVFAKAGYAVTFVARGDDKVDAVRAALAHGSARAVEKGRLTAEDADSLLGRVAGATTREALGDVDLVVEAIAEDLAVKQDLFRDLDRICKPGAILATTTSSLPIIDCAKVTRDRRTSSACTSSTRRRS